MCREVSAPSRSEFEAFGPKSVVHARGVRLLGGGVLYTPHFPSLLSSTASEALRLRKRRRRREEGKHHHFPGHGDPSLVAMAASLAFTFWPPRHCVRPLSAHKHRVGSSQSHEVPPYPTVFRSEGPAPSPPLVQGGHLSPGKFHDLNLGRKREVRAPFLRLLLLKCLQFKIIKISKWHILGWHDLIPLSLHRASGIFHHVHKRSHPQL